MCLFVSVLLLQELVCFFWAPAFEISRAALQFAPPLLFPPPAPSQDLAPHPKNAAADMSTPKLFAQALPSLRLAPRPTAGPIARHIRCYTKSAAVPLPAAPSRSTQIPVRRSPWPTPLQRRPFSASAAVSHGHVEAPKPGEEYGLPIYAPGPAFALLTVPGST